MDKEKFLKGIKIFLRFAFVTVNNFYCIPVHVVWLLFLSPLQYFAENLYWSLEGMFFRWLLSMVGMWSFSAGYHIKELGDDISDIINERTVILFNHQSTSDVPLIMAAFHSRMHLLDNVVWIMDKVFKRTNFGVVSWAHGDFFIRAGREHRESSLKELAHHMKHFYIPRDRKWIILFPEGGFLRNRKPSSQRFALKNNLPHLENVSLPRVGALKVILDEMAASSHKDSSNGIKYLVDVTIAYPGGKPLDLQTIVGGWRPPCDTIFHYRRYNIEELPKAEEELTTWLYQRYFEKEEILQKYYDHGSFPEVETQHERNTNYIKVPQLQGLRICHDPLEFILRHAFYIASTWLWFNIIWGFISCLCHYVS